MKVIRVGIILFFLLLPSVGWAYCILFYYNSGDGSSGGTLQCAAFLLEAGHQVTTVNVGSQNRDPTSDDWASFDQVWDMRFVDRDKDACGSGSPLTPDYFDSHWRSKAVSFLNHCGKLFIAGEYYRWTDRDEGLYHFLTDTKAVKEGYDSCPPSPQGNSMTRVEAFYPVYHGLGPATFFGAYVGGIPLSYLNGTNFVSTREDWLANDQVDRSIVSGWEG